MQLLQKYLSLSFWIIVCYLCSVSRANSDTITPPPGEENCVCGWSSWMSANNPTETGQDDETYSTLRKNGYHFCQKPVDIQCFSITSNRPVPNSVLLTCNKETGAMCTFLCEDYQIRVACCYCPPKPIGPLFQISAQPSKRCLTAAPTPALTASPSLALAATCDSTDQAQIWSWVSSDQIKNQKTQQCVQVNGTTRGSLVVTADCDAASPAQRWTYDKLTTSLAGSGAYLGRDDGRITDTASRSHWHALVDIGSMDLTYMKGMPCQTPPTAPAEGSVDCPLGTYQGSQCAFSCDYGYRLPDNAKYPAVCMTNGQFNATSTTCERVVCSPELTTLDNGAIACSNGNFQDSNCVITCDVGHKLSSTQRQSICQEDGWDNYPLPQCERTSCTPAAAEETVSNGFVNCSMGNLYNSRCSYKCDKGYELVGPDSRLCLATTKWSAVKPICQKISCARLIAPGNGSVSCTESWSYGSDCSYKCDVGYLMDGSATTTCQYDATWSSVPPTCMPITCSALKTPSHGSVACSSSNYFGSECTYRCVEGYRVKSEAVLTCTGQGWNYGSPECTRIECSPAQREPSNGRVTCSDSSFYASRCNFSCFTGFQVTGSKVVTCGANGWNAATPTCQLTTCPAIRAGRNGAVECSEDNNYKSHCIFRCMEGYRPKKSGSDVTTTSCRANGTWSRKPFDCKRIKCRNMNLRRGKVNCTDGNLYNSVCSFICNDGTNIYGATQTTCGAQGWDEQIPTCERLSCFPTPSRPVNGKITCTSSGRLSCTYSCNEGFTLQGTDKTHCQKDETWTSTDTPTCQRIRCSTSATAPSNGKVSCTSNNQFGSECSYSCNEGYLLEGENRLTCTETGAWDLSAPKCNRISCPALNLGEGSVKCNKQFYYSSNCSFSCNRGFNLIGTAVARCQVDGTWTSKNLPYCERITCSPDFSNPSNGRVECLDGSNFGSVCDFYCLEGFSLKGSSETRCNTDGWSSRAAPTCKKITCPDNTANLKHGTESCDRSNEFRSECTFHCEKAYELVGEALRSCTAQGTWTAKKPNCTKIECPSLKAIANGQTHCNSETKHYVGDQCSFTCDEGYERDGYSSVTCLGTKLWSGRAPGCVYVPTTTSTTTTKMTTTVAPTTTPTTPSPSPTTATTTTSPPTASTEAVTLRPPTNVVSDVTKESTATTLATSPPPDVPKSPASADPTDTGDPGPSDPATGGIPIVPIAIGVGVVLLLVVGIVIFLLWRKRSRKPTRFSKDFSPVYDSARYDDSELKKLIPNGSTRGRYAPVTLDRLESEFNRRHADDDKLFREEFSALPEGTGAKEAGGKIQNKEKNRYTNILPYDHSRVKLPKVELNDNDYINASFVDGYKHKGKFIAAQGPKEGTINDFWRMIWDQNVTTIIMVTNLEEGKEQTKCAQYWPGSGKDVYGDLSVVFLGENRLVDYTIRKFTIQQMRGDATLSMRRNLMHYHFTSWPDFGVPKSPSGMLKFMRKIKHGSPTGYGAIVVHCSAGVGRTGTFICIDAMVDMMLRESKVDVHGFVSQMRSQRPEMVQTEQQYIFIYNAMLEHHLYGDTEVEASEVNAHIDELNQRLPGNVTGMEHEFRKLTTIRIQKEQMRFGNHPANMRKNRVVLILPYDWNRVILPIRNGLENSDYINASYIDGYRQKDAYIATQGPLPHTVEDFWRMIWDSKSASIVMLTELVERGQAKCEQYWPAEGAVVYGDLCVDNRTENEFEHYTTRDFVITSTADHNDRKQSVRQFHYHGWPESGPPVSGFSMIALVEQVQKQQQTSGNHPITIHCSAGAGRTGAFCALSTALEQVKAEGILDMFQIVKCLRMQRPHMVQNLEQYEFCYRAVQEYIDSMSEYYNFK